MFPGTQRASRLAVIAVSVSRWTGTAEGALGAESACMEVVCWVRPGQELVGEQAAKAGSAARPGCADLALTWPRSRARCGLSPGLSL